MSMRATTICRSSSCRRAPTGVPTNMAARLENRTRLLREMIEVTREAVGGKAAVAVRMAVDELHGPQGITADGEAPRDHRPARRTARSLGRECRGRLGNDSKSARFSEEGYPGRLRRLRQVDDHQAGGHRRPLHLARSRWCRRSGAAFTDFIGAARPSIADPFLPTKIREGREDEIRECIGCNICRAANNEARAAALHAEPDHGRGMAARLASGAHRAETRATRRCWSSAAGRRGSNARWPWASAAMR